jgi:hypothetical protein
LYIRPRGIEIQGKIPAQRSAGRAAPNDGLIWLTVKGMDIGAIKKAATEARKRERPTVLEIPISAEVPPLI